MLMIRRNRSQILTLLVGMALGMVLAITPNQPLEPISPARVASAQATTTKPDLITNYRTNVSKFLAWKDDTKALRAQYDALAFSWADGDFTGANSGITASQFTTYVTNASAVVTAWESGGTLASGFPTTFYRVK